MTYEVARQAGAHHVVGVANANSTPGFLTKLRFTLVTPLDARLHWRAPRLVDTATPLSWRREWSSDDLAWRFANPAARYFRRGNTVFSPTHIPGISATMRLECDVAVERGRFTGIGLWIGTSPGVYFPAAGGVAVPERFRKSPLNLIFRPLQDFTDVLERGGVHFEALDFDAY
jgi:hypothetical protein